MTAVTYGKSGHVVEAPVVEAPKPPKPGTVRITIELDPEVLVHAGGSEALHRMLDKQIERVIEKHIARTVTFTVESA